MATCFISYAKSDHRVAEQLVVDVQKLGLNVWFDAGLHDNSSSWNAVLDKIRQCSVFLAIVSDRSKNSPTCLAELEYARSLEKTILPLRIERSSLPEHINSQFQAVDYDAEGRDAALVLGRTLIDVVSRSLEAEHIESHSLVDANSQNQSQAHYLAKDIVTINQQHRDTRAKRNWLLKRSSRCATTKPGEFVYASVQPGHKHSKSALRMRRPAKARRTKRRPLKTWIQISAVTTFLSAIATIKLSDRTVPLSSTVDLTIMGLAIGLVAVAICYSLAAVANLRSATAAQRLLITGVTLSSMYAAAYVLFTGHSLMALPDSLVVLQSLMLGK